MPTLPGQNPTAFFTVSNKTGPLLYFQKRGPDRSSMAKKVSFDVKIAKIGLADLEIICLREIIKKDKKEGNYGR